MFYEGLGVSYTNAIVSPVSHQAETPILEILQIPNQIVFLKRDFQHGVVFNSTSRREAKRGLHERKESEGRDDRAFNFLFSYFVSSLMTTMLSIAQMFAATYRLKKPVTLVLLIFVHSLPMVAAHAQEIK
jgi:hypothetical protein